MSCLQPPPSITLNQAHYLACILGINLQVISLEEWLESLKREEEEWEEICSIYLLAQRVRDNLYSNRNYYRGGNPYVNPSILRVSQRCRPGRPINYLDVNFWE